MTPGRLETFADGVFANRRDAPRHRRGAPRGPPRFTRGRAQLERVDRKFLFLNIGLLACIAFVPFPTRILAEFVRSDERQAAALLYGITLTVTAVFFISVWLYASRGGRLLHPNVDPKEVSGITRSYLPGTPMYAAATLVAFVSPEASAVLFGVIAAFYMISSSFFGRAAGE